MDDEGAATSNNPHDEFITEFAKHSRSLYAYIRTIAPNHHDADDIYQSTSLVMWRKLETYQPGTSFLAWGRQVAFYEVKKLRQRTGRATLLSDEALSALSEAFHQHAPEAESRQEALATCLEKLAPASRRLIEQRYYSNRSPASIAAELRQSAASVYRSLARVHVWLMACIESASTEVRHGG